MPSPTSQPKSILRPPSAVSRDSPAPSTLSREDRNRQLAFHHAHLIQYRKDIESQILTATETLLGLPSSSTASSSNPSHKDAKTVKDSLRPFQPSDYDALVEERNIDRRCGYVLCPRENRRQTAGSKYRVIAARGGVKGSNLKVVESKELERWCGDECGKRALYLRVQLSEEPAWMRDWQTSESLELYEESQRRAGVHEGDGSPPQVPTKLATSDTKQTLATRMKDLAVERGDKDNTAAASARVAVDVKENLRREQVAPVPPTPESTQAGSIEGYIPIGKQFTGRKTGQHEETDEDIMPTI
ncbi:MAG: hypothetical protein L6R40_000109 [Gallowayella cf. fulva]|nr:MAG: hypothetical protein L6R40_000109 [Xanthomendoza cf. fulva]